MAEIYGQLVSAQFELLATAPSNTPKGRVYFDTAGGVIKYHDGSGWKQVVDLLKLAELSLANPMTAQGDLMYGGTAGAVTVLPKGNADEILRTGTVPSWGKIVDANVDAAAGIAQSKILNLSSDLSTITSNVASKADAAATASALAGKADAATTTSALALKADASAVATSLAAKLDRVSGVAQSPNFDLYVDFDHEATPTNPSAGKLRVYAKSDNKLYQKTPAGIESALGGGGLAPTPIKTANYTAEVGEMVLCNPSAGAFSVTFPPVPAGGGSIGVIDVSESASATKYVRVTPSTGQSLDNYPANDTLDIDTPGGWVIYYAAPGATSWKSQDQSTSMVQGGQLPGNVNAAVIGSGFIGETLTANTAGTLSLTNNVARTVQSLALPTGEWLVFGHLSFSTAGSAANTVLLESLELSTSTDSLVDNESLILVGDTTQFYSSNRLNTGALKLSVGAGGTTVNLNARMALSAGTTPSSLIAQLRVIKAIRIA